MSDLTNDIEMIKEQVAQLQPGDDYQYRVFKCAKCKQVLPFIEHGEPDATLHDAHDCIICREHIGLICISCVNTVGESVQCSECHKEEYTSVRCNKNMCQHVPYPTRWCLACRYREKSFD